jgi:hypothetical protein
MSTLENEIIENTLDTVEKSTERENGLESALDALGGVFETKKTLNNTLELMETSTQNAIESIKDVKQQNENNQSIITELPSKAPALEDQNIQASSNNETSIMKPSTEIAMKVQLEEHSNEILAENDYYEVSDFAFVASNASKICPSGNCEYEMEDGEMYPGASYGENYLRGKFKVDTGESTKVRDISSNWKTVEERETPSGNLVQVIEGELGIGRDEFNPEHKYQINGTLTSDNEEYLLEITDINSNNKN